MMKIKLNGEDREMQGSMTIAELLDALGVPRAGTAVALGDEIVPRDRHELQLIADGDRVEVVRAIGGG